MKLDHYRKFHFGIKVYTSVRKQTQERDTLIFDIWQEKEAEMMLSSLNDSSLELPQECSVRPTLIGEKIRYDKIGNGNQMKQDMIIYLTGTDLPN